MFMDTPFKPLSAGSIFCKTKQERRVLNFKGSPILKLIMLITYVLVLLGLQR